MKIKIIILSFLVLFLYLGPKAYAGIGPGVGLFNSAIFGVIVDGPTNMQWGDGTQMQWGDGTNMEWSGS
ncbi:MAG: hypothetical protein ACUZ8H_05455 [Candidatus Anammoxibacter sp.]